MIPPTLAAAAASTAIGAISSFASAASSESDGTTKSGTSTGGSAPTKRNDTIGQTEFLSLLVAQLQNQDPLNPLDSADFSAQLAQFSSLEQLMQINQRLTDMSEDPTGGVPSFDPVGLLGREITAQGSTVVVSSGDASALEYSLEDGGTVEIEVRDAATGKLVSKAVLGEQGAGEHVLDLDDVSPFGSLADGTYEVAVSVKDGADADPVDVATFVRGTVGSVDLKSNPPVLRIGDIEIPLGDVRDVRDVAEEA